MFGRRRKDEAAWRALQASLCPYLDRAAPEDNWQRGTMAGQVEWIHQHARRGTKVIVNFGRAGRWDTWWLNECPRPGMWVLVDCHLWIPPGTHSGRSILYIDAWRGHWTEEIIGRAARHERRRLKAPTQPVTSAGVLPVSSSRR